MKHSVKFLSTISGLSLVTNVMLFMSFSKAPQPDYIKTKGIIITNDEDKEIIRIGNMKDTLSSGILCEKKQDHSVLSRHGISVYDQKGNATIYIGIGNDSREFSEAGVYLLDEHRDVRSKYILDQSASGFRSVLSFDEQKGSESLILGKDAFGNSGLMSTHLDKTLFIGTRKLTSDKKDSVFAFGNFQHP